MQTDIHIRRGKKTVRGWSGGQTDVPTYKQQTDTHKNRETKTKTDKLANKQIEKEKQTNRWKGETGKHTNINS